MRIIGMDSYYWRMGFKEQTCLLWVSKNPTCVHITRGTYSVLLSGKHAGNTFHGVR